MRTRTLTVAGLTAMVVGAAWVWADGPVADARPILVCWPGLNGLALDLDFVPPAPGRRLFDPERGVVLDVRPLEGGAAGKRGKAK